MNIRAIRSKTKRGFTLVELMIVVAIVGVLAALAIYGVRRYILNAKTAEGRNGVGQMSKDAATAYSREGMAADILTMGTSTGVTNRLCTSSTKIPDSIAKVGGRKYQSSVSDWADGDQFSSWACVRFSMQDPQFYMYSYTAQGTDAKDDYFLATANGDLNGDGTMSTFEIKGTIQEDAKGKMVTLAPNIREDHPDE